MPKPAKTPAAAPAGADPIVRMPGVEVHTGVKRSTVYAKVKDGTFPPPIQLGPRAVGWKLSVLNAWLASRPVGIATEPAGPRKRRAAKTGE